MFDQVVRNRHAEEFRISFVVDVTFPTGQSYNYPEGSISYISVFIEKVHDQCPCGPDT